MLVDGAPTVFVGRDRELSQIEAARRERSGLLWVEGGAGVGKTVLLDAAARRLNDAPVVKWRPQNRSARGALATLEAALSLRPPPGAAAAERWRLVTVILAAKPHLLILDGLETASHPPLVRGGRVRDAGLAGFLADFARLAKPASLILAASRQAADTPSALRVGPLPPEAGAALLRAYGVSGREARLRDISELVDGHPAALARLARRARRDGETAAAEIAARLRRLGGDSAFRETADDPIDLELRALRRSVAADIARVVRLPKRAAGRGGPERRLLSAACLSPDLVVADEPSVSDIAAGPKPADPLVAALTALDATPPGAGDAEPSFRARQARLRVARRRLIAANLLTPHGRENTLEKSGAAAVAGPTADIQSTEPGGAKSQEFWSAPIWVRATLGRTGPGAVIAPVDVADIASAEIAADVLPAETRRAAGRLAAAALRARAPSHPDCPEAVRALLSGVALGALASDRPAALRKLFNAQLWDRALRGARRRAATAHGLFPELTEALRPFWRRPFDQPDPRLSDLETARLRDLTALALRAEGRLAAARRLLRLSRSAYVALGRHADAARTAVEAAEAALTIGEAEGALAELEQARDMVAALDPLSEMRVLAASAAAGAWLRRGEAGRAESALRLAERVQRGRWSAGLSDRSRLYSLAGKRAVQAALNDDRWEEAAGRADALRDAADKDGLPLAHAWAQAALGAVAAAGLAKDPRRRIPEARRAFDAAVCWAQRSRRLDAVADALADRAEFLGALAQQRGGGGDAEQADQDRREIRALLVEFGAPTAQTRMDVAAAPFVPPPRRTG